jgi:DNA-binding Xre family transcriptional regulator
MARPFKFKRPGDPAKNAQVFDVLRLLRGHKSSDLARRAGLSKSCVSKLRTRRTRYPRFSTVAALARAVGWQLALIPVSDQRRQRQGHVSNGAHVHGEARV